MGRTLKKTKINKNTFSMGGGSLADKVANNSRKITLIKNVISTGKSDLGSQLASLEGRSSSPESDLAEINDTLNDIGNALALDFAHRIAVERGESKRLKTDAAKQKNKRAENRIEKSLKGGLTGVLAPIAAAGKKVTDVLGLLALSVLGNTGFELLKNNNKDKDDVNSNLTAKTNNNIKKITQAISAPSKAVIDAKLENNEVIVEQLKKEGFDEGTARVLTDAVPIKGINKDLETDSSLKGTTPNIFRNTNIPGDVSGNAFGGLVINKMVKDLNLNKVNKKGTITEITLPIEKLANAVSPSISSGTESTMVPYVNSVNVANKHMTKTPEIHGIILK